jgi:hypothetical protein
MVKKKPSPQGVLFSLFAAVACPSHIHQPHGILFPIPSCKKKKNRKKPQSCLLTIINFHCLPQRWVIGPVEETMRTVIARLPSQRIKKRILGERKQTMMVVHVMIMMNIASHHRWDISPVGETVMVMRGICIALQPFECMFPIKNKVGITAVEEEEEVGVEEEEEVKVEVMLGRKTWAHHPGLTFMWG